MYETIQNDLIQKIHQGIYRAGDRLPSEKELMDFWHVSRTTVTKALTELSLSGYIHRIQGKGSFANPLSSHLMPGKRSLTAPVSTDVGCPHKIGVILSDHANVHCNRIIRGIVETLPYPDYLVTTIICKTNDQENYVLEQLIQNGYAGIILFPADCEFYNDIILQMTLGKYPLVLIDRKFPGIHCMSVTSDNELACAMAVSHLLELGHRKIAFVSSVIYDEQITRLRYDSYLKEMNSRGLAGTSFEPFYLSAEQKENRQQFVEQVRSHAVTAVFASNAHAATTVYRVCSQVGLRIPEDLSLICFDNPVLADAPFDEFFTHIDQDSLNMGILSAQYLDDTIHMPAPQEITPAVLRPKLIIGRSTQTLKASE